MASKNLQLVYKYTWTKNLSRSNNAFESIFFTLNYKHMALGNTLFIINIVDIFVV